jgi:hypothetical protein
MVYQLTIFSMAEESIDNGYNLNANLACNIRVVEYILNNARNQAFG